MASCTPEDVQSTLREMGLDVRVQVFEVSTATAPEAAAALNVDLGSIVKSLCFVADGIPLLVLAAGDRRVDTRKLAALYDIGHKKVRIADGETTLRVTGYAPGGVAPVGHPQPLPVLIDSTLQRYEIVYAAAGSPNAIFPIPLKDLIRITGGQLADLASS
jgi:Cys-tRNA(Pro) deacylase